MPFINVSHQGRCLVCTCAAVAIISLLTKIDIELDASQMPAPHWFDCSINCVTEEVIFYIRFTAPPVVFAVIVLCENGLPKPDRHLMA
jgi:hypothetical protein